MYYSWVQLDCIYLWSKQYLIFSYLKQECYIFQWSVSHLATAKMSPLPFVFWLLSCKAFLVGQQLQAHQHMQKTGYPMEQLLSLHHMELSQGTYGTAEAAHRFLLRKRHTSAPKVQVLVVFKVNNCTYSSVSWHRSLQSFWHTQTHLRKVLKNDSGRTEGHFDIILFCFPV